MSVVYSKDDLCVYIDDVQWRYSARSSKRRHVGVYQCNGVNLGMLAIYFVWNYTSVEIQGLCK